MISAILTLFQYCCACMLLLELLNFLICQYLIFYDDNNYITASQLLILMKASFINNLILALAFVVISINSQNISIESCIEYSSGICIRCDRTAHLYQGLCYTNILGCIKYSDRETCIQCQPDNFILAGNLCNPKNGRTITEDMLATLYLYDGTSILEDPGAKYG